MEEVGERFDVLDARILDVFLGDLVQGRERHPTALGDLRAGQSGGPELLEDVRMDVGVHGGDDIRKRIVRQPQTDIGLRSNPQMAKKHASATDTLATNVKILMERTGMSQAALAAKADRSQSTINRALRKGAAPAVDTVEAIAGAFKLEAWQLLVPNLVFDWDPQTTRWANWLQTLNAAERNKITIVSALLRDGMPEDELLKFLPQLPEK